MFTDRLRELIDYKCNGKQSILAKKSGLATTVISSYFCRGSQPSLSQLIALSQALECSIGYLAGVEDDFGNITIKNEKPAGLSDDELALIEKYRRLQTGYQVLIGNQIQFLLDQQKAAQLPPHSDRAVNTKNQKTR